MTKQLIEGITLLDKYICQEERMAAVGVLVIFCMLFILFITGLVKGIKKKSSLTIIACCMGILVTTYAAYDIPVRTILNPTIEYQVLINDDAKLKEFDENYKIKDHKGEIYTIVEK